MDYDDEPMGSDASTGRAIEPRLRWKDPSKATVVAEVVGKLPSQKSE